MKKPNINWFACAGLLLAAFGFSAWRAAGAEEPVKSFSIRYDQDTTLPRKRSTDRKEFKMGDLDQAMRDLDRAMVDMDKNITIDFSKMDKEIKQAMEEIKKIDFEKIGREVEASLKKVDWEKTRLEVDKALREAEIKVKEIDVEKIRKEIEKAKKEISAEKIAAHVDIEKIKRNVEEGLAKARTGIERAKKELTLLKEFTEALEKDGLISKKKGYRIEIKNGEMFINGTKQSQEVNEKYRKYFKNEDYTIRSDGDEISGI